MLKIHCDVEGCNETVASSPDDGTHGAPTGWASVVWAQPTKRPPSNESKMFKAYAEAMKAMVPEHARSALAPLDTLGSDAPPAVLTCRAFVCPGCLGKLPIAGFNVVSRPGGLPFLGALG